MQENKIDVTGCGFLIDGKYCNCSTRNLDRSTITPSNLCFKNPNCHYKIALSKQKTVNFQAIEIVDLERQLQQTKAECRELKEYKEICEKLAGKTVCILKNDLPKLFEDFKDKRIKDLEADNARMKKCIETIATQENIADAPIFYAFKFTKLAKQTSEQISVK